MITEVFEGVIEWFHIGDGYDDTYTRAKTWMVLRWETEPCNNSGSRGSIRVGVPE